MKLHSPAETSYRTESIRFTVKSCVRDGITPLLFTFHRYNPSS